MFDKLYESVIKNVDESDGSGVNDPDLTENDVIISFNAHMDKLKLYKKQLNGEDIKSIFNKVAEEFSLSSDEVENMVVNKRNEGKNPDWNKDKEEVQIKKLNEDDNSTPKFKQGDEVIYVGPGSLWLGEKPSKDLLSRKSEVAEVLYVHFTDESKDGVVYTCKFQDDEVFALCADEIKIKEDTDEVTPPYFKKKFTIKLTGEQLYLLKVGEGDAVNNVADEILNQVGDFWGNEEEPLA
jgi:hypothetical protein